jgi:predicted nucleotidyltransferase
VHAQDLVTSHTIYACVVGSRAYGLDGPGSDIDRRGVFQAPTAAFWRLDKPPTHVEGPLPEQFSWELERCCVLALAANPTVLECLWSPLVTSVTSTGTELLAIRGAFLSRRVAKTYGDYAADQLAKLQGVLAKRGEIKWKQAMHMIRLLMAGVHVLRTGEVLVDVEQARESLLAIRSGEVPWERVVSQAAGLREALANALATTALPEEPVRSAVDDFLVRARLSALGTP